MKVLREKNEEPRGVDGEGNREAAVAGFTKEAPGVHTPATADFWGTRRNREEAAAAPRDRRGKNILTEEREGSQEEIRSVNDGEKNERSRLIKADERLKNKGKTRS